MPQYQLSTEQGDFILETDREATEEQLRALLGQHLGGVTEPGLEEQNPVTAALRYGPSFIPAPLVSGLASGAGETAAQAIEGKGFDPIKIGVATAAPPVVSGLFRSLAGLGRAGMAAVRGGKPFEEAVAQGGLVELPTLTRAVTELEGQVGNYPASAGMRKVGRELKDIVDRVTGTQSQIAPSGNLALPMEQINMLRRNIGQVLQERGPQEAQRLYGALMQDIRAAAEQGVPGAEGLLKALLGQASLKSISNVPMNTLPQLLTALPKAATRLYSRQPAAPLTEAAGRIGLSDLLRGQLQ